MLRGVLSATTAMQAQVRNQEVIANNLANVGTPAYRREKTTFRGLYDSPLYRFEPYLQSAIGYHTIGAALEDVRTIHEVGPVEVTGNPLDIVLPQGAYLAVETPQGVRYTRRGDLEVQPDGYLSVAGYRVQGTSGPLNLSSGGACAITQDGKVLLGGEEVGSLNVVRFNDEDLLIKEGNSLFRPQGNSVTPESVSSPNLTVGAIEKSTVDPVTEMVNLIAAYRTYEAAEKALHSQDETLEQAIIKVGRV